MSETNTVNCTMAVRKTCKYRAKFEGKYCCYYSALMEKSRGCSYVACDKYVKSKKEMVVKGIE